MDELYLLPKAGFYLPGTMNQFAGREPEWLGMMAGLSIRGWVFRLSGDGLSADGVIYFFFP